MGGSQYHEWGIVIQSQKFSLTYYNNALFSSTQLLQWLYCAGVVLKAREEDRDLIAFNGS
jgi:hypothetical protein